MTARITVADSESGLPYHVGDEWEFSPLATAIIEGKSYDLDAVPAVSTLILAEPSAWEKYYANPDFIRGIKTEKNLDLAFQARTDLGANHEGMKMCELGRCIRKAVKKFVKSRSGDGDLSLLNGASCILKSWLMCYHYALFTQGDQPSSIQDLYRVALAGLFPIVWRGPWPQGFCVAYAPPGHPWRDSGAPAAWRVSSENLSIGNKKTKPRKPPKLPVPDVRAAPVEEWSALTAHPDPASAVIGWWTSWAETPRCQDALRSIAHRVRRIEAGKSLRLHMRGLSENEAWIVVAEKPFVGELKPMPYSAAQLIRRHNKISIIRVIDGREHDCEVLSSGYRQGKSLADFSEWWTPDPWNPDEPFTKSPPIPCTDGQDIWVYHPFHPRGAGELELRRIDHETGNLRKALPYGAGGVILRLLAERLVSEIPGARTDFDLRID